MRYILLFFPRLQELFISTKSCLVYFPICVLMNCMTFKVLFSSIFCPSLFPKLIRGIGGRYSVAQHATCIGLVASPEMRASLSTCRVLTSVWHVRGLYLCDWHARGLCLCPCGYTHTGLTFLPGREAEYSFSGFVTTNKQRVPSISASSSCRVNYT